MAAPDEAVRRGSSTVTIASDLEIRYARPSACPTATQLRALLLKPRTWEGHARSQWISDDTAN